MLTVASCSETHSAAQTFQSARNMRPSLLDLVFSLSPPSGSAHNKHSSRFSPCRMRTAPVLTLSGHRQKRTAVLCVWRHWAALLSLKWKLPQYRLMPQTKTPFKNLAFLTFPCLNIYSRCWWWRGRVSLIGKMESWVRRCLCSWGSFRKWNLDFLRYWCQRDKLWQPWTCDVGDWHVTNRRVIIQNSI